MKRLALLTGFLLLLAVPAAAQTMSLGLQIGAAESLEDGFDLDLSSPVRELYFGTELEPDTIFKVRAGQIEPDDFVDDDATIDYVDALVEYRFSEVFGSSGLYFGPGFYRARADEAEETDYGVAAGVNAMFPVSRRFALTGDIGYHWVHFEEEYTFYTLTGGVRFNF